MYTLVNNRHIFLKFKNNDQGLDLNGVFNNFMPLAKATKFKLNKWDYIRFKSFCIAKKNGQRLKDN